MDEVTTSGYRERSRGRGEHSSDVTRWVGVIVIGAVVLLVVTAGGLRQFIQN